MSVSYYTQGVSPVVYPCEDILVVARHILFKNHLPWQGMWSCSDDFVSCIVANHEYKNRALMEVDESYKQIIPYFVFTYADSLFLMQRGLKGNEKRLSGKFTLGIGGHIRKEDVTGENAVVDWGMREFEEEILYEGGYSLHAFGAINDDTNAVGRVHLGLVYIVKGDSQKISIKDELAWGELVSYHTVSEHYERLEPWSQMVFDELRKNR